GTIPTLKWYYLIRCTCRIVTKEFVASSGSFTVTNVSPSSLSMDKHLSITWEASLTRRRSSTILL
ncbi:hypothetical protein PIB30_108543, partial [Stylosanthes scabra]|nr:hypothetical protein [Stylosanthes scabra]